MLKMATFKGMTITSCITLFAILACSKQTEINEELLRPQNTIQVFEIADMKIGKYSDVFDSIKLIRLETKKESLIGRIDKLVYYNNRFYILDQAARKAVLMFDSNGRFLNAIGRNGKGPGEYDEPNELVINKFTNEIVIYCNSTRKLLFYSLDGKFKKELMISDYVKTIMPLSTDMFALYLDLGKETISKYANRNVVIIDNKGRTVRRYFTVEPEHAISKGGFNFFSSFQNELQVSPAYSNSIFVISKDSLVKKYFIDFGRYTIPSDSYKMKGFDFRQHLENSAYAYLDRFSETSDYLFFTFIHHSKVYDCYYSKATKELKYGNFFLNDVHGILTGVHVAALDNSHILGYVDPSATIDQLKSLLKTPGDAKRAKDLLIRTFESTKDVDRTVVEDIVSTNLSFSQAEINELHDMSPSDNPILLLSKLKSI